MHEVFLNGLAPAARAHSPLSKQMNIRFSQFVHFNKFTTVH